jgi:hypothetical protein
VIAINVAAAKLAKKACADYMAAHPGSLKFAAGAIGPTNKTLSVSPSVENPALRGVTYDEIEQAYYEQAKALWEGGVDMFLVETIFDTGNAKAAIYALERFFEEQVGDWVGGQMGGRACGCEPALHYDLQAGELICCRQQLGGSFVQLGVKILHCWNQLSSATTSQQP